MKNLEIKRFLSITLGVITFLSLASVASFTTISEGEPAKLNKINWLTIEEVQTLSEKEPRKVIMDVYTDWCGWCKKMDKTTFSDEKVAAYVNENFYAVKLKADSNDKVTFKGQEFSKGELARALRVTGYPTVVFFDESFARFQPVSGFRPAGDFLELLERFNQAEMSQ
ncbi:thioredoxin family protein [Tunicatimonas pelagia]|uniref:thioredoxin family protein n=1 Tax=Tunicatimonas pelagia TaxID=931531 RepID=UPI00266576C8|nr:thioredoxin fold domain-containing protein [Tunicatimonas pelagia]WKN43619.1 thioredoxin fold domain-containing protein [Tunicatimonas pelagia]